MNANDGDAPAGRGQQCHHLVSRGYQKNFANDRQLVVVVDKATGRHKLRGTKSTFVAPGFNSYYEPDGTPNDVLEREWSRVEATCLRRVREVEAATIDRPEIRQALTALFSIHLVRSKAFENSHRVLWAQVVDDLADSSDHDESMAEVFEAELSRPAQPGELAALTRQLADGRERTRRLFVDSMVRVFNDANIMMARWHFQVICIGRQTNAGFILGDTPIVHADLGSGRFGFRDGLAIGDASLLVAPIGRRVAVAASAHRLPASELRNKRAVTAFNSLVWHAAFEEVACHPDDARETCRLFRSRPSMREIRQLLGR